MTMTHAELREILTARQTSATVDPEQLEARKREEIEFHDRYRERGADQQRQGVEDDNRRFYSTTRKSLRYLDDWIRNAVPGKVFLDYGCGDGSMAIRAAKYGAALSVGIDISGVSVENARKRATAAGLSDRCLFIQADCEATALPPEAFDVVLCGGMLHHVDLHRAFPELRRIMAPGGRALAVEALGYNPLIQRYRRRTPDLRTGWESEHILDMKDVRLARRYFEVRDRRHWHLFSIGAAFAKGRAMHAAALAVGDALDAVALRIPGLQLMSWQFSFEFRKP